MFLGRDIPDLLRRAIVERSMQEVLRSDPTWQQQVMVIGWLERPLTTIAISPGNISAQRATMVRLRLPI